VTPRLAWYGDDFTGATDTLATLAQAGLRAMLFLGVPDAAQLSAAQRALRGPLAAVGIAGAARAMAPDAMRAELEPVGAFFQSLGAAVLHYKVCSTFDSAPHLGNIATAVRTLRAHVRSDFVPIVGGQPSLGRYCAFSNLFAAAGAGGTVERIDRHPTMRAHPVTPMQEADLRRHLALQGLELVAAMHAPIYQADAFAQQDALHARLEARPAAVLFYAVGEADLTCIGRLVWQAALRSPLLAVGASSVAQALIAHWRAVGELPANTVDMRLMPASGPVFAFAGSLSPVTARQVEAAASFEVLRLPADALLSAAGRDVALKQVADGLRAGRHVLACTAPDRLADADTRRSHEMAMAGADFVRDLVRAQAGHGTPLRRIGVAGGDTSSRIALGLGLWGLSWRASLGHGVAVSTAHSNDPALDGLELMLKGGQMGAVDVFERLV
jgi:uncharacterized protein YgbK (DUF1537 family)